MPRDENLTPWPDLRKPSQEAYACRVQDIIDNGGRALLEGPCGVGKSIGYLMPAAGTPYQRTCIVTQQLDHLDQLRRDLVRYVPSENWAILKGHDEYWCAPRRWLDWASHRIPELSAAHLSAIGEWLTDTDTMELSELQKKIPSHLVDRLAVEGEVCEQGLCGHRVASEKALDARLVVLTHAGLLKRVQFKRTGPLDGKKDLLTGEVIILPVTTLIIDELHLFRGAVALAYDTDIPLLRETHEVSAPGHGDTAKTYHAKVLRMCREAGEHWAIECAATLNRLTGNKLTIDEARRQFGTVRELENAPGNECDDLWAVWQLCVGMKRTRGKKDRLAFAKENKICKCTEECSKQCDANRDSFLHAYKADESRAVCRTAWEALQHQSSEPMSVHWLHNEFLVPKVKHDWYVEIAVDKRKSSKTGKKLVLRRSCPDEILEKLYSRFDGVIGTSGTIVQAAHSAIDAPIERFATPFDLVRQIGCYKLEPSLAHGVPRGMVGMSWQQKKQKIQHRAREVGEWLRKIGGTYHCVMVLTTIEMSLALSAAFPEMLAEKENDADSLAKKIGDDGGIGIFHSWHGTDVRTDKKKLLVLERRVKAPPGKDFAALALHAGGGAKGKEYALDMYNGEERSKVIQGLGRAIRGMSETCDIFLLDSSLADIPDPRSVGVAR